MALSDLTPINRPLSDSDILIIEGTDGTYKITLEQLRDNLRMDVDHRIAELESLLNTSIQQKIAASTDRTDTLDRVYYSLVRNYNSHTVTIDQIKELLLTLLNKEGQENP